MRELWTRGFIFNLYLLASVFDIFFKSPIVNVPVAHKAEVTSEIKRVVFFVADGLRADTFYDYPNLRPRLEELIEQGQEVVWGISDTRVPTESRPGHIALFAGLYEDPSAVFTGWKTNIVEFDSVFNRSEASIALGSPDVVKMFAGGPAELKTFAETYPPEWQDFLAGNSSVLDTWVFDRFKELAVKRRLPTHRNFLIFLHLLGIDNTGHATKPHSQEYKNGMLIVDNIVSKVESIIKDYYKDNHTLFILTSDHGMTDWGSHGSGSKDETETPFVVWGPGIKAGSNFRIQQADIAALIAGALGSEFPTNSVGKFPARMWNVESFAYDALKANFLQILELLETKKQRIELERNFPLIPFSKEPTFIEGFQRAEKLAAKKDFDSAITELEKVLDDVLEGKVYYERYHQPLFVLFTVLAVLIFICLAGLMTISIGRVEECHELPWDYFYKMFIGSLLFGAFITKCLIGWSFWRCGYLFIPIFLCILVGFEVHMKKRIIQEVLGGKTKLLLGLLGVAAFGVEMLVLSFSQRSVLSVTLILNIIWALLVQKGLRQLHLLLLLFLAVGSLAFFPMVPIIGNLQSPFFTTIGPLVSCVLVGLLVKTGSDVMSQRNKTILGLQLLLQGSVAVLVHFPESVLTRMVSWISLGVCLVCPTLTTTEDLAIRLASIFLGIGTPFSFLGISYETLFLPSLFLVLLLLFKLEVDEEEGMQSTSWTEFLRLCTRDCRDKKEKGGQEKINVHRAFRRAWFHLFFVFMSFFGTGNIGSLSSFDPSSTRCFVSVFSPWVMMVLMLTKIISPFLLVSCFWRALLPSATHVERNFGMLLLFCQGMSLHMFFRVTNEGSWLEIGTSISEFVIVQSIALFLFLLHYVANFLVNFDLFGPSSAAIPTSRVNKVHKAS